MMMEELKKGILVGDRERVLREINNIVLNDYSLFSKLGAIALLPQMGYRYPICSHMFPVIEIDYRD